MNWTNWHRISQMTVNPAESCGRGIYQIRATTADGQPIPIPRACGVDTEGILYIGQGKLASRIGRLMRIHEPNPKLHHQFIGVYNDYGLERIGDRKCLEARWFECPDAVSQEGRLIDDYKRKTGDIPPGNRVCGSLGIGPAELLVGETEGTTEQADLQ